MNAFNEITTPQEINLLVAFFDLTRFMKYSQTHSDQEAFDTLSAYFEFVGDIIDNSGGTVVKFIGDAGLIVFPEAELNRGVLALKTLKELGDAWLAERGLSNKNIVKVHFGPVICGPLGTRSNKIFDVVGSTVNIAATLKSNGLAISPQVFRKLDADTRKFFKKHTPPITYIPIDENHTNTR